MNKLAAENYLAKNPITLKDRSTLENLDKSDKELKKELKEIRRTLGGRAKSYFPKPLKTTLFILNSVS